MDNTLTLQQSESNNPATTGNPQNLGASSLQTTGSGVQEPASQTPTTLNNLDSGSAAIPLASIPQTTKTTTATVVATPSNNLHISRNTWMYGGLVLVVIIFMISLSYGLMRQK